MTRFITFLYGLGAYAVFLGAFLYAIGFVGGLVAPKTIDTGAVVPMTEALVVNILLMSLFAIQHSVMARRQFKEWWTQYVLKSVERSTYVLLASLALVLLFWQWRPIPTVVWQVTDPHIAMAITGLSFVGWLLVLTSTFLINHFELFGLHQVANNLAGRPMPAVRFKTPVLYKLVRHPIYLGFIIAFWAAPVMTVGHLLFAAVTTAYIFVAFSWRSATWSSSLATSTGTTWSAWQCWCRSGTRHPSAFGRVIDGFRRLRSELTTAPPRGSRRSFYVYAAPVMSDREPPKRRRAKSHAVAVLAVGREEAPAS
jgi:protein-S-isoprenylcysteine O-methyltransferase Ste14